MIKERSDNFSGRKLAILTGLKILTLSLSHLLLINHAQSENSAQAPSEALRIHLNADKMFQKRGGSFDQFQLAVLSAKFEPSDGYQTWKVSFPSNVLWSDGQILDFSDVIFTANLYFSNPNLSWASAMHFRNAVESVRKIDNFTVQFTLRRPNTRFAHQLFAARREGAFRILPEHIWQEHDPLTFEPNQTIGSGPYSFKTENSAELVLERNDNWWGAATGAFKLPEPTHLVWKKSAASEEAIEKLIANEIDVGPELTFDEWQEAKAKNPLLIAWSETNPISWPGPCVRQLDFNTKDKSWSNPNLRKAVAAFVNRREIVNEVYQGSTSTATSLFPSYGALTPIIEAIKTEGLGTSPDPDPTTGDALLIAAGYEKNADGIYEKDGEDLTLEIHVDTDSDEYTKTVDLIVDQLKAAGIAASAVKVDHGVFWARILPRGEFQMAYGWLGCGSVVDPYASLKRYHAKYAVPTGHRSPGFKNIARWDSDAAKAFSGKIDEIEKLEPSEPEIVPLTVEAYRHVVEEMPFIPLVHEARIVPFNTTNWKSWPTADNPYASPMYQWGQLHSILQNLEKTN